MTRAELQHALRQPYNRDLWLRLLRELLPATEIPQSAVVIPLADTQANGIATSAAQIARIPLADGKTVAVLEVTVAGRVDVQRNRVALRNLVTQFIDQDRAHAVLGLFRGEGEDYRFSFVARSSEFTADGELSRTETEKRRYTYLLGPGQACRTPAERLDRLQVKAFDAKISDLLDAFKVQELFDEFFNEYRRAFEEVESLIRPTLSEKEPLRLFTQRLLNRLMFLAFIERKGWLKWEQRTDYLAALWDARRRGENANFYRDHLVPLFFEGLNQSGRPPGHTDPRFGRVEYLNGGLFEKADDGTDDRPGIIVPDAALDAILNSETGLFSRYNFTVAESTPLDVEVAVDPEMLGKVFEELVTGRHEQGSYYTPKPIVSFMCREALVGHLASRCEKETRSALEAFVHDHKPKSLRDAEAVLAALRTVTVCDPACGSGAYLLGMLHELLDLRTCLFAADQKLDGTTAHGRKLEIIERNLYGVDKDPFAVNIARLRLWLSLAVEYDGSHPPPALPNLDFKIEQGDSLAAPAPADVLRDAGSLPLLLPTVRDFAGKKARFLTAHGAEKEALKTEITALKQSLKTWLATEGPADAFHWALEFAEVFLPTPAAASLTGGLNLGLELAPSATPGGFDIVLANPPYVRMELIKPQKPVLRKRFRHVHAERADLYVYFYARAHELLRDGGTAAFISSNKWLRAGYGEPLRQHLLDAQSFGVVMDFGELPVFKSAATDAAIFVWTKEPRSGTATRWAMVKDLDRCYAEGVRRHFERLATSVPASQFHERGSRLATVATADFVMRMQKGAPSLSEYFADLGVGGMNFGIKTTFNDGFYRRSAQLVEMNLAKAECDRFVRRAVFGDDVRRFEVHYRDYHLLRIPSGYSLKLLGFDLEAISGRERAALRKTEEKRAWKIFRSENPNLAKYLESIEGPARKRDDQGDFWWELRPCDYYPLIESPKIIFPQTGKECRFFMDTEGLDIDQTVYFVSLADWFLLAVLNSRSTWNYLTTVCSSLGDPLNAGRLRFLKQYLETLPIPAASEAERSAVAALAERTQSLHGQRRARVERFLRDLGVAPAQSTSRNPLEQPWSLPPTEFAKRAKPLQRAARERPQLLYETARDETAVLTEQIYKLEAEIDTRVATLYGLDAEDQRWAAQATPAARPDDKQALFFRVLGSLKDNAPYFPLKSIQAAANDAELALKDSTLNGYLVEAVAQSLIHDAGRGWYSGLAEPFGLNGKPVSKLVKAMEKAFPLLDFTCWSTEQVASYGHHLLGRFTSFVHTERDSMATVGERLRSQSWDVVVNPRGAVARDFTTSATGTVVVRPRTTTQPRHGQQVSIEGLLVELFIESQTLNLMDAGEYWRLFHSIAGQHRIRLAALLDYARERRPAGLEMIKQIKADYLKIPL